MLTTLGSSMQSSSGHLRIFFENVTIEEMRTEAAKWMVPELEKSMGSKNVWIAGAVKSLRRKEQRIFAASAGKSGLSWNVYQGPRLAPRNMTVSGFETGNNRHLSLATERMPRESSRLPMLDRNDKLLFVNRSRGGPPQAGGEIPAPPIQIGKNWRSSLPLKSAGCA